jgi:ABC-2 type transport system ATP-binding protein
MVSAVRTRSLSKVFHGTAALREVDLEVPTGVVFGYLGPNGAGKTTTIRLLAGLLRPTSGHAEVLGLDCTRDRQRVRSRIGYLPGDFVAYPDLTGEQYLRYLASLRGGVEWSVPAALADRLELDLRHRIGTLSHGNRQKIGLVQAWMHRPDVLILDEPTTGLDPLVQREFLALVREARGEGRTVFLSSHILSEVEAVADLVAVLRRGRLAVVENIDKLKAEAVRRVDLTFGDAPPITELRLANGVRDVQAVGDTAHLVVEGSMSAVLRAAAPHGIEKVVTHEPDLEEIFLAYYEREG